MASSVYYKFKAQRDESRITFDGTGISVFDLKREIMVANKMGTGADFDLGVYDPKSNKEYSDEEIIPRSSSVVLRRLPPSKPGRGKAQIYVANLQSSTSAADPRSEATRAPPKPLPQWKPGQGSITQRFDGKEAPKPTEKPEDQQENALASTTLDDEEQAAIAAMFQTTSEQWQQAQEKMAQATPIHNSRGRGGFRGRSHQPHQTHEQPARPPPLGYTCYRCGQKGHWIQECPTNGDQDFDNRPRIKRTTGIPRSFLKAVENPIATGNSMPGVMVTPDGGYVIAQADSATWEKQRAKAKALSENDIREKAVTDQSLACPICSKLFREATKTPCCSTSYCEECIQTHLLEHDFVCPNCTQRVGSLDRLEPDTDMRRKVKEYIYKAMDEAKEEDDEAPKNQGGEGMAQEGNVDKTMPRPDYTAQIATLQDSIKQMTAMLNKPNLNMQDRQRLQIRLQQSNEQLAQMQMLTAMYEMSNAAGMEGIDMNAMNAMGMGMNMTGNAFMGWQGGYGQDFGMYPNSEMSFQPGGDFSQQQGSAQSRGQKRGRPQDYIQVDYRAGKMGRYY